MKKIKIGDFVKIKNGATKWLKSNNYWLKEWPENIDGMLFTVIADYTNLGGNDAHFELRNHSIESCGVNPMWLIK